METKTKSLQDTIKQKDWYYVSDNLTDKNFPRPATVRTENWKLITMPKYYSSQEGLDEIKRQGCTPANAWELAEWAINHREEMKKGTYAVALGQLWLGPDGYHRVPYVRALSDGDFRFVLDFFEFVWVSGGVLLCFCDGQTSDTLSLDKPSSTLALKKSVSALVPTLTINIAGKKEELVMKSEILNLLK